MRILITGGAGFVGSHLADELLSRGHAVHALDDLSTGSIDNIRHLKGHPRFAYTIGSCHESPLVAELVDEADIVYHLAAAVGVELIVESPVRTIETNVHCTEVVLGAAARRNTPVLLTSTSEVYGKSRDLPYREDGDVTLGPTNIGRWSYACSKAIDEFLALAYWKEQRLPVVVTRLFNTVGPRQIGNYGMVIPRFVSQARKGTPLTVYGDGSQTRCFCHVADIVGALTALIHCTDAHGGVFNLGGLEETSILELAERIIAMTGSDSAISLIPYREAHEEEFEDMCRRVPDVSKAADLIGWDSRHSLNQIIADVAEYQSRERAPASTRRFRQAWPRRLRARSEPAEA
jgi:UDP-glucose 4-epimerase